MAGNLTTVTSPTTIFDNTYVENSNEDSDNLALVTLSVLMKRNLEHRNSEVVRMIQVIGRPPIIVLGTIGNLLTFFTMQRGSLKHLSTCFYMAILALADTGEALEFR